MARGDVDGPTWTDLPWGGAGLPPMPLESFGWVKVPALGPAIVVLLLCQAFLLAWATREAARVPAERRGHVAVLWGCAALGIALRGWVAPQTPEIRWRLEYAWSDVEAVGLTDVREYGLGWPLLVRLAGALVGRSVDLPFALNAVLGGLAALPMAGFVRAIGAGDAAARWGAFAMAVMPVLVFFGNTDAPMPGDALFSWVGLMGTARYAERPSWGAMAVAVAGFVCGAQFRVEAAATAISALTLAVALGGAFPWRRRETWIGAVSAVWLLVPHALLVGPTLWVELTTRASEIGSLVGFDERHFVVLNPETQAWVWVLLLPIGLLAGPARATVRVWALTWMLLMGMLAPDLHASGTAVSVNRYQLRSLPFAALFGGLGAAWVARVASWPGVVLVVVAAGQGYPIASRSTVMQREFAFFQEALPAVESPCAVFSFMTQNDTTLYPPWQLSAMSGLGHRWLDIERDAVPTEGCAVYFRSGGCSNHYQGAVDMPRVGATHPACAAFEARWRMVPVVEASIGADPVGPMGRPDQLPGEPIRVGFYRIVGPAEVTAAPPG